MDDSTNILLYIETKFPTRKTLASTHVHIDNVFPGYSLKSFALTNIFPIHSWEKD